jgi:hypothetical protein
MTPEHQLFKEEIKTFLKTVPKEFVEITSDEFLKLSESERLQKWYENSEYFSYWGQPLYSELQRQDFLNKSTHFILLNETSEYKLSAQRQIENGYPNDNIWSLRLTAPYFVFENKKTQEFIYSEYGVWGKKYHSFFINIINSFFNLEPEESDDLRQKIISDGYFFKPFIFDKTQIDFCNKLMTRFNCYANLKNYDWWDESFEKCFFIAFDECSDDNFYIFTNSNTLEDILSELVTYIDMYNFDYLQHCLEHLKTEYSIDLNKIDLEKTERLRYLVYEKVCPKLERQFGKNFYNIINSYL